MAASPGFRVKEYLSVTIAASLLTIAMTWPMAARFTTAGRVDSTDGQFSIWNVAWVAHALTSRPAALWDANIFYPETRTLAFSEANLVAGAIAAPVWLLTHNAYAAHNFALMASFVLAALCMYALVRTLTGRRSAAAIAAVLFAFNSYVFAHLTHIQLLMTFGLPLSLLALHRLVERPTPRRGVALGLALAVQAYACGYYAVFAGLAMVTGVLWFAAAEARWRSGRFWLSVGLAATVAALLVAPLLPAYLTIHDAGFARPLDEARRYSAGWRAYLASGLLAYRWLLPWLGAWREVLFPGAVTILLAITALILAALGRVDPTPRRTLTFYAVLGALAAWASLGPDAGLYRWMHDYLPGMSFLRAPARFGVVVILALSSLSAFAVAWMLPRAGQRYRRLCLAAAAIVVVARSTVGPLALWDGPQPSAADVKLRELPRGVVAAFPFFTGSRLPRQTEYMLHSTQHWQPMINGYSDFMPRAVQDDFAALTQFPSPAAVGVMRRRAVRYVVVHWQTYGPAAADVRAALARDPEFAVVIDDPAESLYTLASPSATTLVSR